MAWETRSRGGSYYTRSKRVNGKVVREYIGTGAVAELAAAVDAARQRDRDDRQAIIATRRKDEKQSEKRLAEACVAVDAVIADALMAAGYHMHKGEWRKRRGQTESDSDSRYNESQK